MKNSKRTPGEWYYSGNDFKRFVCADNGEELSHQRQFVCEVFTTGDKDKESAKEEILANAKLLAAAPELLYALKKLEHAIKEGNIYLVQEALIQYGEPAIKKATE